jgi:catechol-2,3-dioxygenase
MAVTRLNHAVLYVRDAQRTAAFLAQTLGFRTVMDLPGAVFVQADGSTNDHDLALFGVGPDAQPSTAGRQTVGLYHLAWEVDTLRSLGEIREKLSRAGALVGASDHGTTKSLYAHDPDGLEFEVCWVLPADQLTPEVIAAARSGIRPLDLERETAHFGADRRGGVGVSQPA